MPRTAAEVEGRSFLNLLVLGSPKSGKTCTVIGTAIGSCYVINSDALHNLNPALEFNNEFEWDLALGNNVRDIENCISAAKKGVAEGRYQTIVWDTITEYCRRIHDVFETATENAAGESDGRRYWPKLYKHVHNIIDRLQLIPCHLIVNSHWEEVSEQLITGQLRKKGDGVIPMLPGSLRKTIPRMFPDIIYLDKANNTRTFITSTTGVFGPGCKNLRGVESFPADISKLWEAMTEQATVNNKETSPTK